VAFLVGILVGLVASAITWIVSRVLLVPRLGWSDGISKRANAGSPSGYMYRIKIKNLSWTRSALDLRIRAVVIIPSLRDSAQTGLIRIPLDITTRQIDLFAPGASRIGILDVDELSGRTRQVLRDQGLLGVAEKERPTLDELLECREGSRLVVTAIATDSWTGRTHSQASPAYTKGDIRELLFEPFPSDRRRSAEQMVMALRYRARRVRNNSRVRRNLDLRLADSTIQQATDDPVQDDS